MKAVRVHYKINEDYVAKNKANIAEVMKDLQSTPIPQLHYTTFYLGEGRFMHVNVSGSKEAGTQLNQRPSFIKFRTELKESGPIEPPKVEELEYIGSNVMI